MIKLISSKFFHKLDPSVHINNVHVTRGHSCERSSWEAQPEFVTFPYFPAFEFLTLAQILRIPGECRCLLCKLLKNVSALLL